MTYYYYCLISFQDVHKTSNKNKSITTFLEVFLFRYFLTLFSSFLAIASVLQPLAPIVSKEPLVIIYHLPIPNIAW